jgi:quercetin 2,3-dioxygenase
MNPIEHSVENVTPLDFQWPTRDPFLFCVHHVDRYPKGNDVLGPAASLAGRDIGQDFAGIDGWRMYHGQKVPGFPQHPHRGFETVTITQRGYIDHADSLGAVARYGEGDVQWLTAGAGVSHAEMFPLLDAERPNTVELFQIWLNLPAADKMAEPHFTMFWDKQIPRRVFHDAAGRTTTVTVIAGALEGTQPLAPPPRSYGSRAASDLAIWTIALAPGAQWTVPPARDPQSLRTLYSYGGALTVEGRAIGGHAEVQVKADVAVAIEAGPDGAKLLLLQGRPIAEPVAHYGPFVMNTRAELQQAFSDYQRTRFGGWPWPADDPVHGREPIRFARHADGREERAPTG